MCGKLVTTIGTRIPLVAVARDDLVLFESKRVGKREIADLTEESRRGALLVVLGVVLVARL